MSFAEPLSAYRSFRESAAVFPLDGFGAIELRGDDRLEWLQGQATNDVRGLTPGKRMSFCFCEPTGQILAVVDAWALADKILLSAERSRVPAVLERIETMTILEDLTAEDVSDRYARFSVQGPLASSRLEITEGEEAAFERKGSLYLKADRTVAGGWDVWGGSPEGLMVASQVAAEIARLEAGVPRWEIDYGSKTLPPELGRDFESRHVSYSKGCYTGQEVLMRMHSRGHTNRTWVGLLAAQNFEAGETVTFEGREMGTVSSAAVSPELGPIGAATLRNEAAEPGTKVRVGDLEAEVRAMPLGAA